MKSPGVYMMAKMRNGVVYTGVTSNLPQRAQQHREGLVAGFTKYNECKLLVWYEQHAAMESAIMREKQIKGVATQQTQFVIASGAKQSSVAWHCSGLPRRFAPRNDDCFGGAV